MRNNEFYKTESKLIILLTDRKALGQHAKIFDENNSMDIAIHDAVFRKMNLYWSEWDNVNEAHEVLLDDVDQDDMKKSKIYNWLVLNDKVIDITDRKNNLVSHLDDVIDKFDINDYDLSDCDEYDSSSENFAGYFIRDHLCKNNDYENDLLTRWVQYGGGQFMTQLVGYELDEKRS
jgi:hypothetical protein